MQDKDVIYIEADNHMPYITFGSMIARNLTMKYAFGDVTVGTSKLEDWNRVVVDQMVLKNIKELVSRMGFVTIEMVPHGKGFFNSDNTKKLMEAWDD
jgi:hypothetical protein